MNTMNGKPIGGMESPGAKSGGGQSGCGTDTVDMTFSELEALWKKVRPDGRRRQDRRRNDED